VEATKSRILKSSYRPQRPDSVHVRDADPQERVEISLYLMDDTADDADGSTGQDRLHAKRTVSLDADLAKVNAFAHEHGLVTTLIEPGRLLVKLAGTASAMEKAFQIKLTYRHHKDGVFRSRSETISVPEELADRVRAVLGFDTRPAVRPHFVVPSAVVCGHSVPEIAQLYGFPRDRTGSGQTLAILEFGGGYQTFDMQAACAGMGVPVPTIIPVSVCGASNAPGSASDVEVALDMQVAAGVAPGARLAIYFAPNTDQGFVDAITAAIHDRQNRPSVMSISWGAAETVWTEQARDMMEQAFRDARRVGVTVVVSAGDSLAGGGLANGTVNVDYPAASPSVLGCGGTLIATDGAAIVAETVWNSNGRGTGGGVSQLYPLPDYQRACSVPVSIATQAPGRGVPDVAADADPASGYRIVVNTLPSVAGGTSAAAPLWASFLCLVNEARAAANPPKRPVGFVTPQLYATPGLLRPITSGNNDSPGTSVGYRAGPGYSCCTGLGVPDCPALFDALTALP